MLGWTFRNVALEQPQGLWNVTFSGFKCLSRTPCIHSEVYIESQYQSKLHPSHTPMASPYNWLWLCCREGADYSTVLLCFSISVASRRLRANFNSQCPDCLRYSFPMCRCWFFYLTESYVRVLFLNINEFNSFLHVWNRSVVNNEWVGNEQIIKKEWILELVFNKKWTLMNAHTNDFWNWESQEGKLTVTSKCNCTTNTYSSLMEGVE